MKKRTFFELFLIAGLALMTIPAASGVNTHERSSNAALAHRSSARPAAAKVLMRPTVSHPSRAQDDRYDRRRSYWEERIERRIEEEESRDGGDEDTKKDSKQSKAKGDDDEDDSADQPSQREHDAVEQRREYWRNRLEREW